MPIYHVTVQNSGPFGKFYFSGHGDGTSPANDVTEDVEVYEICSDSGVFGNVYKFDQSDPSNLGHPLRFSTTIDGIHGYSDQVDGHVLGASSGLYYCGTPGTDGAYTKMIVGGWGGIYTYRSARPPHNPTT